MTASCWIVVYESVVMAFAVHCALRVVMIGAPSFFRWASLMFDGTRVSMTEVSTNKTDVSTNVASLDVLLLPSLL